MEQTTEAIIKDMEQALRTAQLGIKSHRANYDECQQCSTTESTLKFVSERLETLKQHLASTEK